MYHSRAAALLTGDYADRVVDLSVFLALANGTAHNTVAVTYTVGANIIALLEQTLLKVQDSAVANQVMAAWSLNRGTNHQIDALSSKVAAAGLPIFERSSKSWRIFLPPGSVLQGLYGNTDAVVKTVQLTASLREIDL